MTHLLLKDVANDYRNYGISQGIVNQAFEDKNNKIVYFKQDNKQFCYPVYEKDEQWIVLRSEKIPAHR